MNLVNSVVLFLYIGINGERWFSFHIQRIKRSLTRSDIFDYLLLKDLSAAVTCCCSSVP